MFRYIDFSSALVLNLFGGMLYHMHMKSDFKETKRVLQ